MDLRKYEKWRFKAETTQKLQSPARPRNLPFLEFSKEYSKFPPLENKNKLVHVDFAAICNLREGDLVRVLYGKDSGKDGIIKKILKEKNQVIVSGCNMTNVFWNPYLFRSRNAPPERIPNLLSTESPIHVLNVAPIDPVIKKPTRIKLRKMMTGEYVRISKLSRCAMPDPVGPEPDRARALLELTEQLRSDALRGKPMILTESRAQRNFHMNLIASLARRMRYSLK